MKRLLKKIFLCLAGGSLSFIIAACYGVPERYNLLKSTIFVTNNTNQPIPNLKVTLYEGNTPVYSGNTDIDGRSTFSAALNGMEEAPVYTVEVEDRDGSENLGDFQLKRETLVMGNGLEIKMQPKDGGAK